MMAVCANNISMRSYLNPQLAIPVLLRYNRIPLLVSILTHVYLSTCHFASPCQMSLQSHNWWQSYISAFSLETAYSRPFFGTYFSRITSPIILIPKAIKRDNRFSGLTWARFREKDRAGQDRTVKKVVIFRLEGVKTPLYQLQPKFAWWVFSLT